MKTKPPVEREYTSQITKIRPPIKSGLYYNLVIYTLEHNFKFKYLNI